MALSIPQIRRLLADHTAPSFDRNTVEALLDTIDQLSPTSSMVVDSIVEAVRADLLHRSRLGIEKYGTTLDRKDLKLRDWLQHAYEEHLDAANYLKRAIVEGVTAIDAPTHRHKKRGGEYVLLGIGKMQTSKWREPVSGTITGSVPVDLHAVAIYRSVDDGSLWARTREEFEDGRFEPLPAEQTEAITDA